MADHDSDVTVTTCTSKLPSLICLQVYRFGLGKIFKKIEKEKKELIENRDSMLKKVEKEKGMRTALDWLNDAEEAIDELEMLQKKTELTESPLSNSGLPDHQTYWLCDEMIERMSKLNLRYRYIEYAIASLLRLDLFASGYFVSSKSTEEASEQLWKALADDSIYIIGLYGRRGSGKTTLANAVGKRSMNREVQTFHKVVFATVSQHIDIRKIQDKIAHSLFLKFHNHTDDVRARAETISTAFESSTRILVILDDVREKFDLKDIGIPFNANWKVLLTTRSQRECNLMNCQREIPLHPLSKEQAWRLLKHHSDLNDNSPSDLLNVAHEVAFECEELPGIIKSVGSSLRNDESIDAWKASLGNLKHSKACNQIFLSFERGDTGFSFTSFLYHNLCKAGFKTFMDHGKSSGEEQTSPASFVKAIETSWLSIVVLSENYAYSSQCLDELNKIIECMKMKNQLVWPIFYKIKPSDIRHQQNSYGKAMTQHEKRFANDSEKINKWKSALFQVSNLSGKAYKMGYEYEFIQKILEDVNSVKNHLHLD